MSFWSIILSPCIYRFVDGQDYMAAVADAIDSANKEIFLMDWQLVNYINTRFRVIMQHLNIEPSMYTIGLTLTSF